MRRAKYTLDMLPEFLTEADCEAATIENVYRILCPENGRMMTARRRYFVVEMSHSGLPWSRIGEVLKLSVSTVKALYWRGVLEQYKKQAICPTCGSKLQVTSYRCAPVHETKGGFPTRRQNRFMVAFLGRCLQHCMVWSDFVDLRRARAEARAAQMVDSRSNKDPDEGQGADSKMGARMP